MSPISSIPEAVAVNSGVELADAEASSLRATLHVMLERERRLMELLHTSAPEKIEHDLRNVLNELMLLRTLLDPNLDR